MNQTTVDPTALLTFAASSWMTAVAEALNHEQLEVLHYAMVDPDLECSVRIQLRAGRVVLEVSTGMTKTELFVVEVQPVRPDDGFGHDGAEGAQH